LKQHNTRGRASKAKKATLKEIEALSREEKLTVGIDIGDRGSHYCIVGPNSATLIEGKLATTRADLDLTFKGFAKTTTIAMEAGTHSPWISRYLESIGFKDVIVANPRRLALISQTKRKNDDVDAEKLAMLGHTNARLLYPIRHRGERAQADLAHIRGRAALVQLRTAAINTARGQAKSFGYVLESCDADAVKAEMADKLPAAFRDSVKGLLETAAQITGQIKAADQRIHQNAQRYPEISSLTEIWGVGELTALAFVLTVDDKERFEKSRAVGPYLGMVPGQDQSGQTNRLQRITKEGDRMLRWLLVQCAHCILRQDAPDSDLKRWGLKKLDDQIQCGKKPNKKKVLVAVARKLAVLMHRLWANGDVYDPLYNARQQEALAQKQKVA
jgi:transposase